MYYAITGRPREPLSVVPLDHLTGEVHTARAIGGLIFNSAEEADTFLTGHGEKWLKARVTFRPLHRPDESIVWIACTTNPTQPPEEILNHPVFTQEHRPLRLVRNFVYAVIGLPLYGVGHLAYLLVMACSFLITGLVAFALMVASSVTYAGLVLCGKAGLFREHHAPAPLGAGNVTPINRGAM